MTLTDVALFLGVIAALNWALAAFAAGIRLRLGQPTWPPACTEDILACPARTLFYATSKAHVLNARAAIWTLVTAVLFAIIRAAGLS